MKLHLLLFSGILFVAAVGHGQTYQGYQPQAGDYEIAPYDDYGRPNPDAFEWTGFSLSGTLGTLGGGVDATAYLDDWVNFRASTHLMFLTYKDTVDGIDFDYDWSFAGAMLLFDFYPAQMRNFRISAGASFNSTEVDIKGRPDNSAQFGGGTYSPAQVGTVSGTADFDPIAPYIGIGYGNSVKPDSSITFTFDLGLMFQSYDMSLSSSGSAAGDAKYQEDFKDLESDVAENVDYLEIYPVVSFGIAYHF